MQKHLMNCLITWRITHMLNSETAERGPYAIFDKAREYVYDKRYENTQKVGIEGKGIAYLEQRSIWYELSELIACQFCLSVWVGFAVAILTRQNVLYGFAYSAGALLLGRIFEKLEG